MTSAQLKKKIQLAPSDQEELRSALREAKQRTGGSISLVIAAESASYAFWELFYAVLTAFLLTLCMLPLSPHVNRWIGSMLGGNRSVYLSMFNIGSEAFVVTLFYLLYNIPFFDRIIIPAGARHHAGSARAMECFAMGGSCCTDAHKGILVYVSFFEREVRIVADRGISSVISQDLWNLLADELAESLSRGEVKAGLLHVVERCEDLLAGSSGQAVAAGATDTAGQSDSSPAFVILENERWA